MLYYTCKQNGEVKATYSGRFSFAALKSEAQFGALKSLQKGDDLKQIWQPHKSKDFEEVARILAHEYTHKHIYSRSETGHILNGWRLWARICFLTTGSTHPLKDYYVARTVYLQETYDYHEEIAKRLDKVISQNSDSVEDELKKTIESDFLHVIQSSEYRIRQKWQQLGVTPNEIGQRIYQPVGKWLQANFALFLSYTNEQKEHIDAGFADQGISNDVGTIRKNEKKRDIFLKGILNTYVTLPIQRRESFEKYFDWFWIGQRTQLQTLQQHYGLNFEQFIIHNLVPTVPFIAAWAGVNKELHAALFELTEDALQLPKDLFFKRWSHFIEEHKDDRHFERYFAFFHLHGN